MNKDRGQAHLIRTLRKRLEVMQNKSLNPEKRKSTSSRQLYE